MKASYGVSDAIQAQRREADHEPVYSTLWMHPLLVILRLCADARPEARIGMIQTLFRTLHPYRATLSLNTWHECIWKVTFPLLWIDECCEKTNSERERERPVRLSGSQARVKTREMERGKEGFRLPAARVRLPA